MDDEFDNCKYDEIVKTVPYSLIYHPTEKLTKNSEKTNEKQMRSKAYYYKNTQTFVITDDFLCCLQHTGFKNTIKKIYYHHVDGNNTSFYNIFGKSHINNTDLYFYTEYQENSMGFHDHKLYFSYNYVDLIQYCMPNNHVANFISNYA